MKVVFLGCTDNYGYGFSANVTKFGYVAKGLSENGVECVFHNGVVGSNKLTQDEVKTFDSFRVTTFKKRGSQLISWLLNSNKLFKYLKNEYLQHDNNFIILTRCDIHILLLYVIFSRILGYKIISVSHEWGPTFVNMRFIKRTSSWLYTKLFGHFSDAILPISEYIIERIKHFDKPYYKLPITADFKDLQKCERLPESNFVYCASVYYNRIIEMVIDAYHLFHAEGGKTKLTLILNGPDNLKNSIQEYIKNIHLEDYIIIKSNLKYNILLNEYYSSLALLIPLDPTYAQDEARFSQKIAEYLSSKSPIITNKVGEIKYYFNEDEIITCDYTIDSFSKAFLWVENNKNEAKEIGLRGYYKGLSEFDYRKLGAGLYEVMNGLV